MFFKLLVGKKRGMVFMSDFQNKILYAFMYHHDPGPSGWDINPKYNKLESRRALYTTLGCK